MRPAPLALVILVVALLPVAADAAGSGHGRLGLRVQEMTPALRAYFDAPEDRGVLVAQVEPGTPAADAGIEAGDVILEAGGQEVDGAKALLRVVGKAPEGEPLALVLLRRGERLEVSVIPRGRPAPPVWEREDLWGPGQAELLRELRGLLHKLDERLERIERKLEEDDVDRT